MIKVVCSVYDKVSGLWGLPFAVPSAGAAVRAFVDEVRRPGSAFVDHPEDYFLYRVGAFDDESGGLSSSGDAVLLFEGEKVSLRASGE